MLKTKKEPQKPLQLQQREQEKKDKDEARLVRDVNILRNLLNYNFADIPQSIQAELAGLLIIYGNDLKFLIISIIDIIHDAHHSRDAAAHCYSLPLFKLVVCNIFGITYDLYNYILTNVIPVTQSVLIRLLQTTPGMSGITAQVYFNRQAIIQNNPANVQGQPPIITCTIVRDNVGLGQVLANHIRQELGFQIVYAQTPCMILDAVSVPNPNYPDLNAFIVANPGPKQVTNRLFPGIVTITAGGSSQPGSNYNARFGYVANPAAVNLANVAAAAVRVNHSPAAAAQSGIPLLTAAAIAQYALTAAANTPNFVINFPWNPTVNPPVGFKPVIFDNPGTRLEINPVPITASPSNTPKNWAFRLAVAQGAVGGIGIGGQVAADPRNQQAVEQIIDANARLYILYDSIYTAAVAAHGLAAVAGFQHLTLQEYILLKLGGDFSYCLYVIATYFTFVSTSDIISGLRLSLLGINLLFSMIEGFYVFYSAITQVQLNQPLVARYIPMVLNLIFRKCKVEKKKVVRRLKEQITINKKIKIQIQRQSPRVAGLVPGPGLRGGGHGQSGGVTPSPFAKMLAQAIKNGPFNTKKSPLIEPVAKPKISPENLELLVSVLKTQFNIFKNQLANFEKEGKFCIASNSTNDYKRYCKEIIEFLNCIIDIMSSTECIQDFTTNCSGKSYEECIKSMSSYVLMFPFIFDTETSSWYLNYTYTFSVCLNEYILSLLDSQSNGSVNSEIIKKIINFVSKLKKIAYIERDITPLEYGKNIPFNNAVSLVIMDKCKEESTESLNKFIGDNKLYKENTKLQLTKFDDKSLRTFIKQLSHLIPKDTSVVKVTSEDTGDDTNVVQVTSEDKGDDTEYFKEIDNFFQNFVVDNNILYEDFVKELVSFLIQSNNIIREGIFSVIKFILLFQSFDNISLCSYTVIKTIIEALLTREYSSKSFAAINNEFNRLFYYNNLDNFFHDIPEVAEKIKETRTSEGLTSIDQLSILEQNISVQVDLYSYCEDYALSKFYDELYDDSIDPGPTFETTDEYIDFQMRKLQEFINKEVDKYLSYHEITEEEEEQQLQLGQQQQQEQYQEQLGQQQQQFNPLGLQHVVREGVAVAPVSGGNNNPKSKHKAKYRKKYKKFVSKYIIKKNKKQNKNKNKNKSTHGTKNKTRKNKRLTKPKAGSNSKSKYAKKTLKNKKRKSKSKSSNNKSKHNKKANTNYYNLYKHNKTLKH